MSHYVKRAHLEKLQVFSCMWYDTSTAHSESSMLGDDTGCVITAIIYKNRNTYKSCALTDGPTLPWGPASPGRPVRPCQRRREETDVIQMSQHSSACRHVFTRGGNLWHSGRLNLYFLLFLCGTSNSSTPTDENEYEPTWDAREHISCNWCWN